MNTMQLNNIYKTQSITIAPGQILQVLILNADQTVAQSIFVDTPPADATFTGIVSYSGTI